LLFLGSKIYTNNISQVMEKIFCSLNLNDRKAASLVCRRWNLIAFSPIFTRNSILNAAYHPSTTTTEMTAILRTSTRKFIHLRAAPAARPLNGVLEFMGNELKVLSIRGERQNNHYMALSDILEMTKNLEELVLENNIVYERAGLFNWPTVTKLKRLAMLNTPFCADVERFITALPQIAPILTVFSLVWAYSAESFLLCDIISSLYI
jgi:hypothetical protein